MSHLLAVQRLTNDAVHSSLHYLCLAEWLLMDMSVFATYEHA